MAQTEATIPAESIAELKVKEGDTLTVTRRGQESITLMSDPRSATSRMSGSEFGEKWAGAFDLTALKEKAEHDPRLAYLLDKHVK